MPSTPQKVVVLGSSGSGKTSLIKRLIENTFVKEKHKRTKAVQTACYATKRYPHVTLSVWDTAGEDKFRAVAPVYYNGAMGFVLVYDVNDEATLERARSVSKELKQMNKVQDAYIVVVGTKVDLCKRVNGGMNFNLISEGCDFAESIGARHFVTSSMTGEGVGDAFADMANGVFKAVTKKEAEGPVGGALYSPRSPRSPRRTRVVTLVEDEETPLTGPHGGRRGASNACCCVVS